MLVMLVHILNYAFIIVVSRVSLSSANLEVPLDQNELLKTQTKKQETLPPCQACKTLVNSFKKGMERTAKFKFEGGDTAWEESRLGSYADSEIRLVEIQEHLCTDAEKSSEQCHNLAEQHEPEIEEWWFKKRKQYPDLFHYFCIDKLEVCCPDNHYGPDCKPCIGGLSNTCSGHGQCKGAGTRKGSGKCRCESGYAGDLCEKCKTGYFNDTTGEQWVCAKCDKSCKGHCRETGPQGCEVCAEGYEHVADLGCTDIDECLDSPTPVCKKGTFCVNSIGSYRCIDCDKSCDGCDGDGPDMCDKCADGYVLEDSMCIESKVWQRSLHIEVARYVTYLGLCIATCIIFRRNIFIASIIALFVSIYIGLSEYTVGDWSKRSVLKYVKSFFVL